MREGNHNRHTYNITPEDTCTVCGKKFDICDQQAKFGFDYKVGYGSRYDLTHIRVTFCCDCFDAIIDDISDGGKYDPVVAEYD